jgi:hypothetical protein
MMQHGWKRLGLLWLAAVALAAGCAGGGAYQGAAPENHVLTDVPSSFYGNDPALRQWYTAPYWNPSTGP